MRYCFDFDDRFHWFWGVEDKNKNGEKDHKVSDSDLDSLKSFIDDDEIENDRIFYEKFENVTTSTHDVLKEEYDKGIVDIQKIDVSQRIMI